LSAQDEQLIRQCPICGKFPDARRTKYGHVVLKDHIGKRLLIPCTGSNMVVEGSIIIRQPEKGEVLRAPTQTNLIEGKVAGLGSNGLDSFLAQDSNE